jgi:hypothetical protein
MKRTTKEKDFIDYLQKFDNSISTPEKMQKCIEETSVNIIESTIDYIKSDYDKYKQKYKK